MGDPHTSLSSSSVPIHDVRDEAPPFGLCSATPLGVYGQNKVFPKPYKVGATKRNNPVAIDKEYNPIMAKMELKIKTVNGGILLNTLPEYKRNTNIIKEV